MSEHDKYSYDPAVQASQIRKLFAVTDELTQRTEHLAVMAPHNQAMILVLQKSVLTLQQAVLSLVKDQTERLSLAESDETLKELGPQMAP